MKAILNNH